MDYPVISADSHITEAPGTYVDYIDAKFKDRAPRIESLDNGDVFVIDGMDRPIHLGLVAAAGKKPEEITTDGVRFEELHRSGWDPKARMADQDKDGVAAEIIYPTVGMMLCNHKDFDYKQACFDAYNRWISEYCSENPARLLGCGQTAIASPEPPLRTRLGRADHHVQARCPRSRRRARIPAQEDVRNRQGVSYTHWILTLSSMIGLQCRYNH